MIHVNIALIGMFCQFIIVLTHRIHRWVRLLRYFDCWYIFTPTTLHRTFLYYKSTH